MDYRDPWRGGLVPDHESERGVPGLHGVSGRELGRLLGYRAAQVGEPSPRRVREDRLRALGFDGPGAYERYLESPRWKTLREELHPGAEGCIVCGAHPVQMHHVDYRRLGAEMPKDLRALCRNCHRGVHILARSGAASLVTAAEDYARMAQEFAMSHRVLVLPIYDGVGRVLEPAYYEEEPAFLAFGAFADYVLIDRLDTAASVYLKLNEQRTTLT